MDLPKLETPADLVKATAAIAQAVASGDVTPDEGQAVAAIVETHRRAIETEDLERRLSAIEASQPGGGR
jgi:citrate lyase beta subunit